MGMNERVLLILIVLEKKRQDRTTKTDSQIITFHRVSKEKMDRLFFFSFA
jgi:threonine/homoserine efflux transporter RhtA